MKAKLIAVALAFLSPLTFAASATKMPEMCPGLSALSAVGVNDAIQDKGLWAGFNLKSQYDTVNNWSVLVMSDKIAKAKDKTDAILISNKSFAKLVRVEGPMEDDDHKGVYGCLYSSDMQADEPVIAVTITPSLDEMVDQAAPIVKRYHKNLRIQSGA